MPHCSKHQHLNCRECFPRPPIPLARRCTVKHPKSGRQCQVRCNDGLNHAGDHERTDAENGRVTWLQKCDGNHAENQACSDPECWLLEPTSPGCATILDDDIPF